MIKGKRKAQAVNYDLLNQDHGAYKLLAGVRKQWHGRLRGAQIALAFQKRLKPDVEGHLVLGRCVKISSLNRRMAPFDFVIVLNRETWEDPEFSEEKMLALLDHELCHAAPVLEPNGTQRLNELGERVWRIRRHDIEEFREVVKRHGCYKADLERFAEALESNRAEPLLAAADPRPEATQ